jgi:hypothetical protein
MNKKNGASTDNETRLHSLSIMMKSLQLAYQKKTSKANPEIWRYEGLCLNYTKFNLKWVVEPTVLKHLAFYQGGGDPFSLLT